MEGLEQLAAAAEAMRSLSPRRNRLPRGQREAPTNEAPRLRAARTITISNYAAGEDIHVGQSSKSGAGPSRDQALVLPNRAQWPSQTAQRAAPSTVFIELPVASFSGIPAELFVSPDPAEQQELPVPAPAPLPRAPAEAPKSRPRKKQQPENADSENINSAGTLKPSQADSSRNAKVSTSSFYLQELLFYYLFVLFSFTVRCPIHFLLTSFFSYLSCTLGFGW